MEAGRWSEPSAGACTILPPSGGRLRGVTASVSCSAVFVMTAWFVVFHVLSAWGGMRCPHCVSSGSLRVLWLEERAHRVSDLR